RVFISEKYTNFKLEDSNDRTQFDFRPNSKLNLGIGATYKSFTLNLAHGFKFLNPENGKGETKYLDLQSHIYTPKVALDLYAQFYNGFYLKNSFQFIDHIYIRPDFKQRLIGGSALFIKNHKRFSFKAALMQNEQQLKSAGSLLYGFEIVFGSLQSDSVITPYFTDSASFIDIQDTKAYSFVKVGPGIGYAHTFVVKQKFFTLLSLTLNIGVGSIQKELIECRTESQGEVQGSLNSRVALGYNDHNSYFGITFLNHSIVNGNAKKSFKGEFNVGNVRIIYAKRFKLNNRWINDKLK
ncbi:MAG TPA: DUF4421 family protein, partial [Bacteroidia bacterium]|nr:DUF4421 family protein [Bacteroidia bacterium]